MQNYDISIIGGGPAGYVGAIRAAQLGKKVALIEREHVGGVCLHWGCIPTKSLLHSASILRQIRHAKEFGIEIPVHTVYLRKMVERSRNVSSTLASGVSHLLKKYNISVFESDALITPKATIQIKEGEIKSEKILIATGAKPRVPEGFSLDGKFVIGVREAMTLSVLPKSLIVLGSGAIGTEFASFYATLGVQVTLLEMQPRILPSEDHEISDAALKIFTKQGIVIHTEIKFLKYKKDVTNITVEFSSKNREYLLKADKLLVAAGVTGNTDNLGLENTATELWNGYIKVDSFLRTAQPNIYAAGDVTGPPCLAHKASHEAVIAVQNMFGAERIERPLRNNIPACIYSYPQIASIGLTERASLEAGYKIRIGRFPFLANGKALTLGESEGFIKTIFDSKSGELLGAHMIGAEVSELIHGYVIAKQCETTENELIHTVFPHPTLSEAMHESVLASLDRALHI
jgi:dihydrolipoamide dehydrogenase